MAIASKKWMPDRHRMFSFNRESMHTVKIALHQFTIGDVEDPYIYVAQPIYEWQQTDKGRWCMQNCEGEMTMFTMPDHPGFGYKVLIQGELSDKNLTYFRLRWGDV